MKAFISGGAKNGKTTLGQDLAVYLAAGEKHYYVATMISADAEDDERIRRHIADRAGLAFADVSTGEFYVHEITQPETTLSDEHVTEKIDGFRALLAPEIARERAHWGGSEEGWNEQVDALRANIADDYAAHTVRSLCSILGMGDEERMEYFGF